MSEKKKPENPVAPGNGPLSTDNRSSSRYDAPPSLLSELEGISSGTKGEMDAWDSMTIAWIGAVVESYAFSRRNPKGFHFISLSSKDESRFNAEFPDLAKSNFKPDDYFRGLSFISELWPLNIEVPGRKKANLRSIVDYACKQRNPVKHLKREMERVGQRYFTLGGPWNEKLTEAIKVRTKKGAKKPPLLVRFTTRDELLVSTSTVKNSLVQFNLLGRPQDLGSPPNAIEIPDFRTWNIPPLPCDDDGNPVDNDATKLIRREVVDRIFAIGEFERSAALVPDSRQVSISDLRSLVQDWAKESSAGHRSIDHQFGTTHQEGKQGSVNRLEQEAELAAGSNSNILFDEAIVLGEKVAGSIVQAAHQVLPENGERLLLSFLLSYSFAPDSSEDSLPLLSLEEILHLTEFSIPLPMAENYFNRLIKHAIVLIPSEAQESYSENGHNSLLSFPPLFRSMLYNSANRLWGNTGKTRIEDAFAKKLKSSK